MIEQYTTEAGRSSGPTPRRAATPGRKLSSTTSAREQRARAKIDVGLEIADDGFRAVSERRIPRGRRLAHRVAVGGFDPDDPCAEAEELPARIGTREVAREVDDENPGERLHAS